MAKKKKKPSKWRGNWLGVNPVTKKTPTLKELVDKIDKKNKQKGWED